MNQLIPVQPRLQRAPTLGNAVQEFVSTQFIGTTPDHRSKMLHLLEEFVIYISRRELSARAVAAYGQYLQDNGKTQNRIRESLYHVRKLFEWCWRMGYTQERWHEYIPRVKGSRPPPPQIIGHEEYLHLRKMCLDSEQDWIVVCGYSTGFRMGDCCKLKWQHINQETQVIAPLLSKTSKSTGAIASIPYQTDGDLHQKLKELWSLKVDDGYVCPNMAAAYYNNRKAITQCMRRIFNRAGLIGRSFKHFRCTFESRLANSGMNIGLAAKITGRSDTKSLLRYIVPDMEAAREGVAKALELHHEKKMFA